MEKGYTKEQLDTAERFINLLMSYPPEKRKIIVIAANSFLEGMSLKEKLLSDSAKDASDSASNQVLQDA